MSSRMNKYYDENEEFVRTRYSKNEELYKEISKSDIDNYEIGSNTTVLGENKNEIDVEAIKKILDHKYNVASRRQNPVAAEEPEIEEPKETTKEYDINVFLEKAKEQKPDDYKEERFKKLRDTQFDILKTLNLEKNKQREETNPEENLKDLINTIAINEKQIKDASNEKTSLDIFSELMGGDDTEVLEGLKEEVENQSTIDLEQEYMTNTIYDKNDITEKNVTDTQMINSFYTSSNALNDKDFEDMDDFSKSIESGNLFLKIIIGIIVIIFIIGIVILIKTFYLS